MHSFSEALDLLLKNAAPLPVERLRIERAPGRVLRQEIRADRAFPPFDRVMMDGFALRSADLANDRSFRIVGAAPAGKEAVVLTEEPGVCLEVMTGAPLPPGADCIVPVEETTHGAEGDILVNEGFECAAGRFIHAAGSDAAEGELLLRPGTRLGSREIGVAVSCGAGWVEVSALPKISVLATGDELVAVDEIPAAHQIRQSNAHAAACALERAGFPAAHVGMLGDDVSVSEVMLRERLEASDWLVLTGAVSKGARDFLPGLLDSLGCRCLFHGVAQRPGKPAGCWLGPAGQMIMALPGNPVSALTGLHAFVLPGLAVASGMRVPAPRLVVADDSCAALPGMTRHLAVTLGPDGRARSATTGNSGDFIGLLKSDGFLILPPRGEGLRISAAFPFTPWI